MSDQSSVLNIATKNATLWTSDIFDIETRQAAQAMLDAGGDELIEPFYKDLDFGTCLLYTSPSPRDRQKSRMPSSA